MDLLLPLRVDRQVDSPLDADLQDLRLRLFVAYGLYGRRTYHHLVLLYRRNTASVRCVCTALFSLCDYDYFTQVRDTQCV